MATPIIRALKTENTNVDIFTGSPEVFKNNPYIRKTFGSIDLNSAYQEYDRIINLDLSSMWNPKLHQVDGYSLVAFNHLLSEEEKRMELFPSDEDKKMVDDYLAQFDKDIILIHMRRKAVGNVGAGNRNMPDLFWLSLLLELNKFNLPVVQIGTANDFSIPAQYNVHSAIDKFNIQQLQYLCSKAKLVVCADSSVLHIAGTTQTPIICLFTIIDPELRRPALANFYPVTPKIDCAGCWSRATPPKYNMEACTNEKINQCVEEFSVSEIISLADSILNGKKSS